MINVTHLSGGEHQVHPDGEDALETRGATGSQQGTVGSLHPVDRLLVLHHPRLRDG